MDEETFNSMAEALIVTQGVALGTEFILMELMLRIVGSQPEPEKLVRSMFESISARLDQGDSSPGEAKRASAEMRDTISRFFSHLERALARQRPNPPAGEAPQG